MPCYSLFSKGTLTNSNLEFDVNTDILPKISNANDIIDNLLPNKSTLYDYSVDDLIMFFDSVAAYWKKTDHPLKKYHFLGLSYLPIWLSKENLIQITNISIRNNRQFLDRFQKNQPSDTFLLRAQPMGIIGHWIAGNIPILGMISLVQGILTKNLNIVRVSYSFGNILSQILDSFNNVTYTNNNGKIISGSKIAKTISVIYYDKTDINFANDLSKLVNVRVVWGGKDAVESISDLKKNVDTTDIIFGPKYSLAIIDKSFLSEKKITQSIAQKLAFDISVYEQRGCNSPHTVFVENKGNISIEKFCEYLGEGLEKSLKLIPKGEVSSDTVTRILNLRAQYAFTGIIKCSDGIKWTVLYMPEATGIAEPCYGRTIFVRSVNNIYDVLNKTNHHHQSIGLAIKKENKMDFVEELSKKGISRCPDIGSMSLYEIPWDGMFPMEKMVRWVSVYE